ncbi:hypothetical protein RUM43_007814 [Polyplax serrata]|uniref:Small ribosomal subunit protein uS5m n=1 Tax=Polyplax serrata TaxID=468196 RepID=A0AAN8SA91_POLSC
MWPQLLTLKTVGNNLLVKELTRNISFFNKISADELWKGVISVSNAGKKRGRGRGGDRRGKKNLNFGQRIGEGTDRIQWPGLNTPVLQSNTMMQIQRLPPSENKTVNEAPLSTRKFPRIHPMERGWSGRKMEGRNLGPPESDDGLPYRGFNSIIIENRLISVMTGNFGRKRRFMSIAVVGNGKGLIGLAKSRALDGKAAMNQARKKAMKRLVSYDFLEENTVNHDFHCQFGNTKVLVLKKNKGYGLVCHRAIKACCELLGIKDLYAKVEGSTNTKHVVKAFLIGLLQQKTYQNIADDNKLHLVEFRQEKLNYPQVLASPEKCLTDDEVQEEEKDFHQYLYGGRVLLQKPKPIPFYQRLPSWKTYLMRNEYRRNHGKAAMELLAEYGTLKSYLADRYPECVKYSAQQKHKKSEESEANE